MSARFGSGGRRPQRRHRKLRIEDLERRLVLSYAPADISSSQQQIIETGLDELVTWAAALDGYEAVAQALPVVGYSIGHSLDLDKVLDKGLVQPVHDYFDSVPEGSLPTSQGLVDTLQNLSDQAGIQITVAAGSAEGGLTDPDADYLLFEVDLEAVRTYSVAVSLGPRGDEMGLAFGPASAPNAVLVDLATTLVLNFTFGVDLTPDLSAEEAFLIRVDDFELSAEVLTSSPTGDMVVGFYDARVTSSTLSLDAALDVTLNNPDSDPDGNLTLAELKDTDLDSLVTLTPAGTNSASATMSVEADPFGDFTPGGTLSVSFSTSDPFDPPALTFSSDFAELLDFTNVSSYSVLGVLNQLGSFLHNLRGESVFDAAVQLAGSTRLGDVVDLGGVIKDPAAGLIKKLTTEPPEGSEDAPQPKFDSVQSLAAELMTALGLSSSELNAAYDENTRELTFHLVIDQSFVDQNLPFGVDLDLSPLGSLDTSAEVVVAAGASLDLVFGIDLNKPVAVLKADAAGPADGKLSAGSSFWLQIGGQDPVAVTVSASATDDNTELAHLVADLNVALTAAGLDDDVEAGLDGDRVKFSTKGPGVAASVRLLMTHPDDPDHPGDPNDPILTQVHFVDRKYATDSVTQHTFFESASIRGEAGVTATDIGASAEFGFLGVEVAGGSGTASVAVDLELKNPTSGVAGGRVYLPELFRGLAQDVSTVVAGPTVSGSATATLPFQVTPNILGSGHPANPRLELEWPDVTDADRLSVEFVDAGLLEDFTHLDSSTVLSTFAALASYLADLEGYSWLDQNIPGIERSVAEVIDYAAQFLEFVAALEEDPGSVLQDVEARIEQAFGLNESLVDLSLVEDNTVIRIDVTLEASVGRQLPFQLDLAQLDHEDLGTLFDISASGQLDATARAVFNLDCGIDISDPLTPRPCLYETSQLSMGVTVAGNDIQFTTALGPLGIWVKQGRLLIDGDGDPDTSADMVAVSVLLNDGQAGDKIFLSDLDLDDAQLALTGQVSAHLPVYFPTEHAHLGNIDLVIADVGDIENSTTLLMPDFESLFGDFDLLNNLGGVLNGVDYVLTALQDVLSSKVFSTSWPLIGDGLQDAADFIGDIRTDVIQKLRDRFGENFDHTSTMVQQALYDALGPAGLEWLKDRGVDGVTMEDIMTTAFDLDADGESDDQLEWSMWLGQEYTLADVPVDFDIGIPALGLDVDANVRLELGFVWKLAFGINRTDGPYLVTDNPEDPGDEFFVYIRATTPGLEARGNLLFFQLDVRDHILDDHLGSRFMADVSIDLKDPDEDGKLTMSELWNFVTFQYPLDQVLEPGIAGSADVALDLTVSYEGDARFPSLSTTFKLGWGFSDETGLGGGVPTIQFEDVRLNLGQFISDFADSALKEVRKVTEPLQPIFDFLTEPLPVISDFGLEYTPLDLVELFGYGDVATFIEALDAVVSLINDVPVLSDDLYIPLGSFELNGEDVVGAEDLSEVDPVPVGAPVDVRQEIRNNADADAFYSQTEEVEISFPILEQPLNAFRLLLGQDVDLFLLDLPKLQVGFGIPIFKIGPLGPYPIFISLAGYLGVEADLKFGYDTYGLRTYLETNDPLDVFSGFFISDRENADGTGKDVPEGTLTGGLDVGVEVGVVVAAAGVSGGISLSLFADLDDPDNDGKVHLDEFLGNLNIGLLSTFDVSGEINFVLKAYFELLFSRIEVTILEVTLASFELEDEDIYVDRFAGGGGGGGGGGLPPGGSGELPPADQIRVLGIAPGLHVDGLGLDSSSDVDWYEFELLRSDSITVDVRHNYVHGDLNLDVYDALGTLLGSSYTDHDREIVSLDALPDGKYYVRVSGQRNNYMVAVEPNENSTTRVIYVNPAGKLDRSDSYYTTAPGDDKWDGLLYRKPKATLESVLAGYDLGPDDLIVLDSGQHAAGAVIAAEDEGATIIGSVAGSYISGVVLRDSDHTLFEMVGFRGSGTGLHLEGDGAGDAQGNVVRRCVFDAIDVGIQIDSRESNLIENNRFVAPEEGSAGTGIYLSPGVISTVRDNDIAGRQTGIYNDSRVADVYGNLIHQNAVGMSSRRGVLGPDNPAPYGTAGGLPVNIMDANGIGILIPSDAVGVVVRFNEIRYSGEVGIDQQGEGSRIIANHVHDNPIGIRGTHAIGPDGWGAALHILVQANEVGVLAQNGAEVRYNRIYENGTGIQVESDTWIHHNLIYRNSGDGVLVEGARNVDIVNNTIYAPGGDGVRVRDFSEQVLIRDNIIYTQSGHGLYIEADSQFGYASDYNNLYATGGGRVAFQGKSFDDVYDWQVEAEMDLHSIGRTDPHPARDDPRFVSLDEDDFHLMSESTSIDAGHPGSDYSREPDPNGGRVNLGAYGNTPEAATSPASWLRITAPNFYVDLVPSRSYQISWETYQVPGSDTLDIDLVEVGPETHWDVATVQVSAGSVTWSPGDFVSGDTNKRYRIALSTSGATSLTAASRETFSIPAIVPDEAHTFYVNDESTADDEYTTAIGDNRNTGTTTADPKVVIRPLVLSYNLDTGDEVRVDTGGYVHAVNLNLSGSPMTFDPRMNTVRDTLISGPTDLNRIASVDRANEYRGSKAFDIIASDEMELRHLMILGAWTGVHVRQSSDNLVGEHLTLFDHSEDGMTIEGHSDGAVLDWLTVHDNGRDGVFADSLLVRITHSKVYDNGRIGLALRSVGGCLVETSEVYGNRTGIDIINPGTARAVVGHGDLTAGLGNRVYENDGDGIFASGNVLVAGNTVAKNGLIGIHLDDGADAERNVVRQHVTGISALGSESNVIENRSYENTDTGIEASYASYLHRNVTYSNGNKGIYVDRYSGVMDHNLVYDTGWASIHVAGPGTAPELINNTVYEPCPYNEFEPPPDKTTIEIPWRWHVEMEGWEGWHVLTFEGTARIEFQPPAGQIPGETFDLGRGGGADAKTLEPVPPDQEWTIATEIVELNLRSTTSVYGGPMLATLDTRAASTGLITVSNVDGQLVGEAQFEIFVQFELPDGETRLVSGELLPKPVQTLTLFGEGGELEPYDVLQAAIPLAPAHAEWITLFAQLGEQPPLPPPWGSWIFGGGFLGPPPQDAGRYCAEIGILVSDSSSYVLLRNNAVFVEGSNNAPGGVISRDVVVAADSTTGWQSDFNVLTTTYGAIGEWAGQLAPTLAQWQIVSRDDDFSLDPPPRTIWVDPDGLDDKLGFVSVGASDGRDDNLHLRSPFGEVAQGALAPVEDLGGGGGGGSIGLPIMEPVLWQSDASPLVQNLSPAVDMGDPQYAYSNAPAENGQMINI